MIDAKYLAEIKAREQAATKGPWVSVFDLKGFTIYDMSGVKGRIIAKLFNSKGKYKQSDAAFIAHARTDIPALLSDNAAKDQQIDTLKAELQDSHQDHIDDFMRLKTEIATLGKALEMACEQFKDEGNCILEGCSGANCIQNCAKCMHDYFIKRAQKQEGKK